MKFGVLLLNQILTPGTALQLRKPSYDSTAGLTSTQQGIEHCM